MTFHITTCPHCEKRNRVRGAATGRPRCANCGRWLPWIADADDGDFDEVVRTASLPVLVDVWATWCGPCRVVSPVLEQLATERSGELKLVKVDVDRAPAVGQRFAVQAVPTLLVVDRDGEVLGRRSGAAPVAALRDWLDHTLSGDRTTEARA
ncbi:thioredoxin [Mycobacterium yunnanensis]|uniref:Thioredoxin n=1 Tax=Mycobacterium yunnanensis TaxID=368477 RepID=A0A9X2YPA4_9MYCO|nr:thioredoxin [Mycobacterium yunnanensis]MCV7423087.1 thioredoxin [Mycobacterium yunnanensis]